jgi:glutamate mutase epsilon subunit
MYLALIELGIQFLVQYLGGLKGAKVPAEIAAAIQAAIDALLAHKQDVISKSNLDTLRG